VPKNEALRKNYFLAIEHEIGHELTPMERLAMTPVYESFQPEECPHFITSWANDTRDGKEQSLICCQCGETLERRFRP